NIGQPADQYRLLCPPREVVSTTTLLEGLDLRCWRWRYALIGSS
ncbi:hypothetical protein HMPREF3185_01467, partial [Porphyromonas somerae]